MPASRKPIEEALAMAGVLRPARRPNPELTLDNHSGATTDEQLLDIWLKRYDSKHTVRAYSSDFDHFMAFVETSEQPVKSLGQVTVAHLSAYTAALRGSAAPATAARRISSIKSLLSFGHETGYLRFNVGAAIKSPKVLDYLGERILSVEQVRSLVGAARPGRDRALVKFLYFSGARVSEACGLQWKHIRSADGALRVTLHGKGKKTRHVPLPTHLMRDFDTLGELRLGAYVFESCYGNPLDPKDAWRIVHKAAEAAYLTIPVSPHWLRHAHATHALARGAPPHVVKETLGHSSLATTGRYAHVNNTESSGLFLSL